MLFTTCLNGHDITEKGSFFYKKNGDRQCRKCFMDKGEPLPKRTYPGLFCGETR